jgi:hypothetical protein
MEVATVRLAIGSGSGHTLPDEPDVPPSYRFQLELRLLVAGAGGYGGSMEIREAKTISAADFKEVADILSKFHDLMNSLRAVEA